MNRAKKYFFEFQYRQHHLQNVKLLFTLLVLNEILWADTNIEKQMVWR